MDVKTSFLNGELEEEIYMTQSDGLVVNGQKDKVCKLQKSLYDLKQAPKQWHEKFNITLISVGFSVNEADRCVYYHYDRGQDVSYPVPRERERSLYTCAQDIQITRTVTI
jgi:hypothetical protein